MIARHQRPAVNELDARHPDVSAIADLRIGHKWVEAGFTVGTEPVYCGCFAVVKRLFTCNLWLIVNDMGKSLIHVFWGLTIHIRSLVLPRFPSCLP